MYPGARGVTLPVNQGRPTGEGPSNTVVSAMRCEFVAVEYFDQNGRRVHDLLLKAGDSYYAAPNGQVWAETVHPIHDWLRLGVLQKLPLDANFGAQVRDQVAILPSEEGKGAS